MIMGFPVLPRYDVGSMLGQALGQGLQKGSEFGLQRSRLRSSLDEIKNVANNPSSTAFDLASSLMYATAGIPGSERYIGQLYPILLQQMQAKGGMPQPGETSGQPTGVRVEIDDLPKPSGKFVGPDAALIEPYLGSGLIPNTYTPEQIAEQEYQDTVVHGLPESKKAHIMRQYNENAGQQVQNIIRGQQLQTTVGQAVLDKQKQWEEFARPRLGKIDEDDWRTFNELSREEIRPDKKGKPETQEERFKRTKDKWDRFQAFKNNVMTMPIRNLVETDRNKQMKNLENIGKQFINFRQRDLGKKIFMNNLQFGDAESELILNPLKDFQKQTIFSYPKLKEKDEGIDFIPDIEDPQEMKKYEELYVKNLRQRREQIKDYGNKVIKKLVKPGSAEQPGISLTGLRKYAMENTGLEWEEFNELIHEMLRNDEISLDPYQTQELPKLSSPPVHGFSDWLFDRK